MIPTEIAIAATDLASSAWVRVGTVDDIPLLEGRRTTIDGRRIAVFKLANGAFAAIDATCPSEGGPLQDGLVADTCVTCPLHEGRIDLFTGEMAGSDARVDVHDVHVAGEELFVRLASAV
jgi:nitrite reductase (NADH) small subunit